MFVKVIQQLVLSAALVFSTLSMGSFEDIPSNHWAVSYMQKAYQNGWMTGKNDKTFDPDGKLTRAELVTLLSRFDGAGPTSFYAAFKDTDRNAWYAPSLNWAVENGIIQGYIEADGTYFRPDQPVSRQEVWTILERYAKPQGSISYNLERFSDWQQISSFALKGARFCASKGILSGKEIDGNLFADPFGICTRAESCKILCVLDSMNQSSSQSRSSLSVINGKLCDASGNPIQLQGISSHGLAWYGNFINSNTVFSLKNLFGINTLRLALYTEEYGGYCSDGNQKELKDQLLEGVRIAKENGLYAIVDWHILSDGNPLTHITEASSFFREISSILAKEEHVLYEICNEPNGSATWADVKSYANTIIPIIRANDPDAVVIVGTPNWSQRVDQAASDPLGFENILYSLHFYAGTHHEDLFETASRALDKNLPMIITEFGSSEASGNGNIDEAWTRKWVEWAENHSIGVIAWSLSDKGESSALLKPGTPASSLNESNLSPSGILLRKIFTGHSTNSDFSNPFLDNSGQETVNQPDTDDLVYAIYSGTNLKVEETGREEWNEGNMKVYLLRLKATNTSSKTVPVSFSIELENSFDLQNSWNCNVLKKGTVLEFNGPEWKKELQPAESLEDMGIILKLE